MDLTMYLMIFGGASAVAGTAGWLVGNRHGWRACDLAWWEEEREATEHPPVARPVYRPVTHSRPDELYRPRHARWDTPTEEFHVLVDATWTAAERDQLDPVWCCSWCAAGEHLACPGCACPCTLLPALTAKET